MANKEPLTKAEARAVRLLLHEGTIYTALFRDKFAKLAKSYGIEVKR